MADFVFRLLDYSSDASNAAPTAEALVWGGELVYCRNEEDTLEPKIGAIGAHVESSRVSVKSVLPKTPTRGTRAFIFSS